jgi:class 3 adenylate cyclase/tetratricopeptide (TPR) repeat protein
MVEVAAASREERKIVTVLFADLVGFTARSEQLDPEEVRAFLSPYYVRLRMELERYGGTVEKFIGDAVMALFGAPVAHEDDPERAVRAALAIRDWVVQQGAGLQLRIAVNTGEVLVALGAHPDLGEGMASGDVVNTTARLQAAAPVNGILVGETTYRATSQVITYRVADPVAAKGKVEPVPAWEVLEAPSRFGVDLASTSRTPLVGRNNQLGVLTDALAQVRRERSPQLVTIVGVPGIGKSRLVAELFQAILNDPAEAVLWRQGRSLPYGDGVTFWALAEMVKAQTGIMETDAPEQVEEKLQTAVAELTLDRADLEWIAGHLRPLAGLGSSVAVDSDRREEAFTAWRRFFEALAEAHPLTLVFEDLHWADDNLLDFVEHLVDWASGVPMLIICNARPELFERRPTWAGGKRHATTLPLSPLSDDETTRLITSISDRPLMPQDTQQALLARAGGNPLYAEQYVRMLAERGDAEGLPLPETVQGIIAARLDGLPAEEKSLLQKAAVTGKVFWLGAVLDDGGSDHRRTAELRLHALERKDFVQRARRSSVANETEYSFVHVLVRDVAYGQIPRARRAEQHRRAAEWIGSLGGAEDHAEMLAHHFISALDLRRATGQPADASLAARALGTLRAAGDRAVALNAYTSAAGYYRSAVDLASPDTQERARLLFQQGRSLYLAGDGEPGLLHAARDGLLACGDRETAAEADVALADLYWIQGDRDRAFEHINRARELIEGNEPSRVKAYVISHVSRYMWRASDNAEAIRIGREALGIAEQLGLDDLRADALQNIGLARQGSGDPAGISDLEEALAIALAAEAPVAICRAKGNLAGSLWELGRLEAGAVLWAEAAEMAARFGLLGPERWYRAARVMSQFLLGRWREALVGADRFIAEVEAGSPHYAAPVCYYARAHIRLAQDDVAGALADAERALGLARLAKEVQVLYTTVAQCADVFQESGDTERGAVLADEFLTAVRASSTMHEFIHVLHVLSWTLSAVGRGRELIEALPSADVPGVNAAAAFAAGDLGIAADICAGMGALAEEARDRLWLAEALVKQNRRGDADVHLQRALAYYRSVGATRFIREAEGLFAER